MCSPVNLLPESFPIFSEDFGGDFELATGTVTMRRLFQEEAVMLVVVVTMKMRSGAEKECCR